MKRRSFLRLLGAGALAACGPAPAGAPDARRVDGGPGPDAAAPDAAASVLVLHYTTTFASPEVHVVEPAAAVVAMSAEGGGRTRAELLRPCGAATFYVRDAATGNEDHPPGGGLYRAPGDLCEIWLEKGAVFDVDPARIAVDLIDAHTHPLNRDASNGFVVDAAPLLSLLPANGIGMALVMIDGSVAEQESVVGGLAAAHPWLVPLAWMDAQTQTAADAAALLDAGCRGLKFHPTLSGYAADGALMDPFLELAAARRVAVQIHSATDDPALPTRILALAARHPAVPVVMVHTGLGVLDKTALLQAIAAVPNVYAETSWSNAETILQTMSVLDSSRTLFGTDATVDGWSQFSNQSIADPAGAYTRTIPATIAAVREQADPGAFENWAFLTAVRLYGLRFAALTGAS